MVIILINVSHALHKGQKDETDIEKYKLGHKTVEAIKGTRKTIWSVKLRIKKEILHINLEQKNM